MIETLNQLDTRLFLWINSHHNTPLDWTMWTFSQHWSWAIVIIFAAVPLFLSRTGNRAQPLKVANDWWLIVAGVVLCFLLADQGSVHLFKEQFHRLRPCHAIENVRMFMTHCGGKYGFVSSHAANAFALCVFLCRCWRKKERVWPGVLLVLWALLTCYSRAYLGKHYPGDLLCGAVFGCIIGLGVSLLKEYVAKKMQIAGTK